MNHTLKQQDAPFLFLDLETSGLHANKGAVITEVALLDRISTLIDWRAPNQDDPVSSNQRYIVQHTLDLMEDHIIVGHNILFDLQFLEYISRRDSLGNIELTFIDTLSLSRICNPDSSCHTLSFLAAYYGIEHDGELHSAITDAQICRELFWLLVELFGFSDLKDVGAKKLSMLNHLR